MCMKLKDFKEFPWTTRFKIEEKLVTESQKIAEILSVWISELEARFPILYSIVPRLQNIKKALTLDPKISNFFASMLKVIC